MKNTPATLIFAAYAALVTIASLLPAGGATVGSFDKAAHLVIYAIFAALACRLDLSVQRTVYICIGIIAYSGLLEVAQSFVPGRQMSARDLLANTLGVFIGAVLYRLWAR